MAGQGGRAEGAALVHQALREVVHAVLGLFALLGLAGHLPVPGLDAFLLHGQRSVDLLSKGDRKDGTLVFCVCYGDTSITLCLCARNASGDIQHTDSPGYVYNVCILTLKWRVSPSWKLGNKMWHFSFL